MNKQLKKIEKQLNKLNDDSLKTIAKTINAIEHQSIFFTEDSLKVVPLNLIGIDQNSQEKDKVNFYLEYFNTKCLAFTITKDQLKEALKDVNLD